MKLAINHPITRPEPTMIRSHQVAVQLDSPRLKLSNACRLKNRAPYAAIISMALACLENTTPTSPTIRKPLVIYALLPDAQRQPIKRTGWCGNGEPPAGVSQPLPNGCMWNAGSADGQLVRWEFPRSAASAAQ